jgi:hypothetical protein
VEEQGRGANSRQWPGAVEVGTSQVERQRVRGGIGEGARGLVRGKENGPGSTETEEFFIYSKEFQKKVS